jgi:hypothetical protein
MQISKKQIGVVAMVAVLTLAAGPAMAALTYDNETTNTTTTSDLVGGETVTDLDNSSVYKYIEVQSDNATSSGLSNPEEAFKLKMTVNDADHPNDGRTFYVNSSTFTVEDATNGHYSINVSHADMFAELERDVNQDVNVDVTVVFNESESDEEKATISITARNGDSRAVDVVTDEDVNNSSNAEITNESRTLRSDLDYASVSSEEEITENTTFAVVFAASDVEDKYTSAYDAADFSAGDYIHTMTLTVEGHNVMVYNSQEGDAFGGGLVGGEYDPANTTVGVFHLNGGEHGEHATLEVTPKGDMTDETFLSLETSGNKKLGFWSTFNAFGFDAAQQAGAGVAV